MIKLAHLADLHCCREHAEEALASLRFFVEQIKTSPVDLVTISGDVWDASILNTEASGFNRFVDAIRDIADLAPVALIYGTPSHDTDNSLEVFQKIDSDYGIRILEPGEGYLLQHLQSGDHFITGDGVKYAYTDALLFGIPEPRRKYLLADTAVGKDETEEAIREAMHKLCFLLAAKRQEYPDIPCIVLYHGDIAGSVLQNDRTIERGTGISITIDDLGDIGADYIGLGHIHKPQRVGNLPAYYAGSIYPKNFGETHQAGFNVVTLTQAGSYGWNADVQRIDFPHPQNLKIETSDPMSYEIPDGGINGKRVWLEITCSKEQKALISINDELAQLRKLGAVDGSRVTICELPVETVRAAEITAVSTPAKKFEVWAQNSHIEFTESQVKKIEALDTEITQGAAKAEGEWELVSVRLRGAIGIKKGIHKDEIVIDFDHYGDGLIALTGANGKGKTTLIENCHPYPQLHTRKGKLQDHFLLKNSLREVIYRNRGDGSMRKFLMQIDGQNKNGACKYFIFQQTAGLDGMEWEPLPGVDGNLKPYEEAVSSIFGPKELYLRTAFITQRPTKNLPDLTDATAGEKKALFVELAGIDYLQRFADTAGEKAKEEAAHCHDAEIKAQMLEAAITGKDSAEKELKEAETALTVGQFTLEEVLAKGKGAKADVDRLQAAWEAERQRQWEADSVAAAIAHAGIALDERTREIAHYQEAAQNKGLFEKRIAEGEALQNIIEGENAKKQHILEKNAERQREFAKIKADFDAKVKELEKERSSLRDRRNSLEQTAFQARHTITLYERETAEIKEACPTCGQRLPENKLEELKTKREQFLAKIESEMAGLAKCNEELESVSTRIEECGGLIAEMLFEEPEPDDAFDDTALQEAALKLRKINLPEVRACLAKAQEAATRIEGLEREIKTQKDVRAEKEAAYANLTAGIEAGYGEKINAELEAAKRLHAELTNRYTEIKAGIARNEAVLEATRRKLAEIGVHEKELAEIGKAIMVSRTETAEWELLAKAFGKDGIQALELDALAPGISETANRILESAYGDRFRIEIRTTRMGGNGKKTKQLEDFLIYVTDSEDGEAVLLDDKSGGEAVWIKRAIYDAFAVIRKRNTNFSFLTCFQDEADGALDSAAKTAYCRMLEAVHAESKLRHTVIITHSNEVKAMIEQKIDMEELAQ